MDDARIILCTCPDPESAGKIADALVAERLAACVNRLDGVSSLFNWQDRTESAQETLLVIKSRASLFATLRDRVKSLHPYEVPELLALAVTEGDPAYMEWMEQNMQDGGE